MNADETAAAAAPADPNETPRLDVDPDDELVVVAAALDWALVEMRRAFAAKPPRAVPPRLVPLLRFSRFPSTARKLLREALDDDDFRARVSAASDGDDLDRASWLLLHRPQGWEEDYLAELAAQGANATSSDASENLAERVEQLTAERSTLVGANAELAAEVRRLAADVESLRAEVGEARRDRDIALGEAEQALRTRRELTEQKRIAARLGAELQAMRRERDVAQSEGDGGETPKRVDRGVAATPDDAGSGDLADEVRGQLESVLLWATEGRRLLAELVGDDPDGAAEECGPTTKPVRGSVRFRRPRVEPGRGRRLDSADGVAAALRDDAVTVFVDGYNVAMGQWPRLTLDAQRTALLDAVSAGTRVDGAAVVVVFDGDELVHARPHRSGHVAVRFTSAHREADDEILDAIERVPLSRPVLVVSSDNRVRRGAVGRGADAISSELFVRALTSPQR